MQVIGFRLLPLAFFLITSVASAVTIQTVLVGNPGNPADTRYSPAGIGSVDREYRIGKTKVSNAQYVEFLNAVASSDPYGLYHPSMGSDTRGGVLRLGSSGAYSYEVKADVVGQGLAGSDYTYANKPVVYVSWYDAIRFANWLHNGQGNGDTETGAYTLGDLNSSGNPIDGDAVVRNEGASWFIPNEDEWYKAAFHKNDGASGNYWDYPTGTDDVPNNNPPTADTGNSANFGFSGSAVGNANYPLTDVNAYLLSESPYGTLDQGGNVREWNETLLLDGSYRGWRGADWINSDASFMHASAGSFLSANVGNTVGSFRVAAIIPEPSALLLGAMAVGGLALRRQRFSPVCLLRS